MNIPTEKLERQKLAQNLLKNAGLFCDEVPELLENWILYTSPHFDSVRRLRNAAAHNTCMISNLKPQNWFKSDIEINFELLGAKLEVGNGVISSCLKVPVLNDFAMMLSNYVELISSPKIKEKTLEEMQDFFNGRMILHKDYFENVNEIKNAYHFAKAVLDYYCKK